MISPNFPKKALYILSLGTMLCLYAFNFVFDNEAADFFLLLAGLIGIFWVIDEEHGKNSIHGTNTSLDSLDDNRDVDLNMNSDPDIQSDIRKGASKTHKAR